MNTKNLFEMMEYGKHRSSYFDLPASAAVLIAYLLPGLLGTLHSFFSYFASLILIAVAIFEKKSEMVKFYSFQFCFLSLTFNIILTVLSLISYFVPFAAPVMVLASFVIAVLSVVCTIYSLVCAFQYRGWVIPFVGPFVLKTFLGRKA